MTSGFLLVVLQSSPAVFASAARQSSPFGLCEEAKPTRQSRVIANINQDNLKLSVSLTKYCDSEYCLCYFSGYNTHHE